MLDARAQSLIGDWDLYTGSMHTELHLDASGTYIHTLWGNIRKHWGTWAIQDQNGAPFLVLTLTDAYPRVQAGPYGWQQIPWPAWEAWPILQNDGATVMLGSAWMHRQNAMPANVPTFAPAPALPWHPPAPVQAPMPAPVMQPMPAPPAAPPIPTLPPEPVLPRQPDGSLPSQAVLDQFKKEHDNWNAMRDIIAQIIQEDRITTQKINDMYEAQGTSEYQSQLKNSQALTDVIHDHTEEIIKSLRP